MSYLVFLVKRVLPRRYPSYCPRYAAGITGSPRFASPAALLGVLLFILFSLKAVPPVLAHVLVADGNIGAVMHVDPDDDPIAGSPASFFFDIKDRQNQFASEKCNCNIQIVEDGQVIFTQPLFADNPNPSLSNASAQFTFPERNVYQLRVIGQPLTPGQFQPFTLIYDIRVSRVADNLATSSALLGRSSQNDDWWAGHWSHWVGGILVGLLVVLAVGSQLGKRK